MVVLCVCVCAWREVVISGVHVCPCVERGSNIWRPCVCVCESRWSCCVCVERGCNIWCPCVCVERGSDCLTSGHAVCVRMVCRVM